MEIRSHFFVLLCSSIFLFSQQAFADLAPMASLDSFDQNGSFYISYAPGSTFTSENWSNGTAYSWKIVALSGDTTFDDAVYDNGTWYYPRHVDNATSLLTFNFSDGQQYTANMSGTFYFTIAYTYDGSNYVLNPQLSTVSQHGTGVINGHSAYTIFMNGTGFINQANPGVDASGIINSVTGYLYYGGTPTGADFTASPTNGTEPLTVNFTDQSAGAIAQWSWSFGDGSTSTAQNPTHTYATPGTYTVSLTVTGPGGTDTEIKTGYVGVYCACDLNKDGRCNMQDWLKFGEDWGRTDCPIHRLFGRYQVSFTIDSCSSQSFTLEIGGDSTRLDDFGGDPERDEYYLYVSPTQNTTTYSFDSDGDLIERSITIDGNTLTMHEELAGDYIGHFVFTFSADTNSFVLNGYVTEEEAGACEGTVSGSGTAIRPCECDLNVDGRCNMSDWLSFGRSWGRTNCPIP